MEINDIKELIELIKETDITELRYEKDGMRISLKRGSSTPPADPPAVKVPVAEALVKDTDENVNYLTVKSPIVGTFYRSSTPGAAPLVELGDTVRKGQALCIVEAMKLMNEIESEVNGVIVKIFHENGTAVEYGEPLFQINPL
ncbi:acetyl-CoA carboxylase biotin carboxyl carrier protein [Candidatus Magnetominusculus xianensis]|uniref:Biotin carboxyl carrier protein of acetyl-CoA carboxylase n=1 Tax=Candidatus Magnetominusculus xianensis TaxID=1748249 RepID=A0ABR5SGD9_9BACT|nr:acetyl-CoA carboxylase biotin carboxyl carrier protein [Candidatus Magnetominusculus xianensis]KWT85762.1 acetyl-CoA carboxylase biotin carboxyl carrier protein subunit [Candidatus Magnetominusculus xianensis]MBF0405259.1 acetyl-CoA carboxylase biotin carboxyl carrier protein [Nitrospirota bacterium]